MKKVEREKDILKNILNNIINITEEKELEK